MIVILLSLVTVENFMQLINDGCGMKIQAPRQACISLSIIMPLLEKVLTLTE